MPYIANIANIVTLCTVRLAGLTMVDVLLHLGIQHADLSGPVVWAGFAFLAGIGVGKYAERLPAAIGKLGTDTE